MSGPDKIFIDARVAGTMSQDASGPNDVEYLRADEARKLMRRAQYPNQIVQIIVDAEDDLLGLSSRGEVYVMIEGSWSFLTAAGLPEPST